MPDYASAVSAFRLEDLLAKLNGNLDGGFNVAEEALYRHPERREALIWVRGADRRGFTYGELAGQARAMAAHLSERGIGPGDRVAGLLPKRPELVALAYAVWHLGAVYVPLFTAFGPEAIEHRLRASGAKLLVTDADNAPRVEGMSAGPPLLRVDGSEWRDAVNASRSAPEASRHPADRPFILLFTSGTTGQPKGVPVPLSALPAFWAYMEHAVDLRPEDRFWNLADPGWAYGLYYGLVAPMLMGQTIRYLQERFDAERAYAFLAEEAITNFCAAPTAYRTLKAHGVPEGASFSMRAASSAGEPLNPEVIEWFHRSFGAQVMDHYGQTELGMVIANHHALSHEVRPGSMGHAIPGFRPVILDTEGREVVDEMGELAVDVERSPLFFFPGYWGSEPSGRERFEGGYYRTGDVARVDRDGYFWFASRADDVILTAGYRVGPFEVESTLMEHEAVAETAVLGRPDRERGELVVAYVVLREGERPSDELARELQQLVKKRLAAHAYPREVRFVEELPKTASGKVQRYVLRQQEQARGE